MLDLKMNLPVRVQNGGLFISRGVGRHPARELDSWEIIVVEKGTLTLCEGDAAFSVQAGESLLLWPHRRHYGPEDFPADLKFYWLHFDVHPLAVEDGLPGLLLSVPQHCTLQDPQYVVSLFRQFLAGQENLARDPSLELILLLILQQLSAPAGDTSGVGCQDMALAWKAQQLIRTQFHLAISTSQLARQLHCNGDYLGRIYRRAFGITITGAIHRQRVLSAEKLLLTDSCSLSDVAAQCGFHDVAYFRQVFRKQMGLTPAAWRRRYCREHINSG